jgi:signal transduction histidine kinase
MGRTQVRERRAESPIMSSAEVLQGVCHALGSAGDLDEAASSAARWVRAAIGSETAPVRLLLPDRAGRLRVAFAVGEPMVPARSDDRRAAFETKRTALIELKRPAGHAMCILPLISRGEVVGVLEVLASGDMVRERWAVLEAVTSQTAIVVRNLRQRLELEREVGALGEAAELVQDLVEARTPVAAVRAAVTFCFEHLRVPVLAWVSDVDPWRLTLVASRGVGASKRKELEESMGSLPRWQGLPASDRRQIAAGIGEILGAEDVVIVPAGGAILAVGAPTSLRISLETVGSLLECVLRNRATVNWAERRNERLDLGISWTAHELRSPLLGAKAVVERLLQMNGGAAQSRELLSRLQEELGQLAGLADELLWWAVGAGPLQRRSINLSRLVHDVVRSTDVEAGDKRVTVSATERVMVRADAGHLRGAIGNLIRNALAYTPPTSEVAVAVTVADGAAVVEVKDRGPGLPEGMEQQIFDPFVRGENGHRGGRGLGLFIARRVVEAHGGTISAESDAGGTTFRIQLPLSTKQEAPSVGRSAPSSS